MMEERYRATTQNWFYPDMSNVNKNITVEAKLIRPPAYIYIYIYTHTHTRPPLWSSGQSLWLQIQRSRVRSPALPDFLSSSGSETGSTQPREVN